MKFDTLLLAWQRLGAAEKLKEITYSLQRHSNSDWVIVLSLQLSSLSISPGDGHFDWIFLSILLDQPLLGDVQLISRCQTASFSFSSILGREGHTSKVEINATYYYLNRGQVRSSLAEIFLKTRDSRGKTKHRCFHLSRLFKIMLTTMYGFLILL